MAVFPLFISLDELPCLVVGGGKVALRKVKTLLEYGARVTVIAPQTESEIDKMNGVEIRKREFREKDLQGMRIVFVATSNPECNRYVAALCREKKILVNVADVPEECDFFFPALVRRKDVVVGISTGGKSPAAARKIREELDRQLPGSVGDFVEEVGELRTKLKECGQKAEENAEYMERITAYFGGQEYK